MHRSRCACTPLPGQSYDGPFAMFTPKRSIKTFYYRSFCQLTINLGGTIISYIARYVLLSDFIQYFLKPAYNLHQMFSLLTDQLLLRVFDPQG